LEFTLLLGLALYVKLIKVYEFVLSVVGRLYDCSWIVVRFIDDCRQEGTFNTEGNVIILSTQ
jgi:hypothetical protein